MQKAQSDTGSYAVLYVFTDGASDERTQLFIDSSAVCDLTINSVAQVLLHKEGATEVAVREKGNWKSFCRSLYSSDKNKMISRHLNVEFGKEYYLECQLFGPHQPVMLFTKQCHVFRTSGSVLV
jgi:hypothetical protein